MAYEALIATRDQIASEAYQAWARGDDAETIMQRGAKDWNVDLDLIRSALTRLIADAHHSRLLSRAD